MLRTTISRSYLKRTIRVLYGDNQVTHKSVYLDPAWDRSVPVWPGMAFKKTTGDLVAPVTSPSDIPVGLADLYVGGDGIDEPMDAGVNAFSLTVMSPGAEVEILAPAFDTTQTWTDKGDGSETLVYVGTDKNLNAGKLVPAGTTGATTEPVARLIKVSSATKIVVGGLR